MNIKDIAKKVSKENNVSIATARNIISSAFKEISKALIFGYNINIKGFGSFVLQVRKGKKIYDFHKEKLVNTQKRYKVVFRIAKNIDDKIKNKIVH